MAIQSKVITTQTQAAKIWRKVQGTAVDAINFKVEELKWIQNLTNAKLAPSLREVTRPVFITRDGGVASISEGGYKARPMSPAPQEISVSLVHLQKQFAIAQLVLMITKMGGDTQVVKQFKTQLRMAIAAMSDQIGDYFWASSTGILATTDTDLAGASTVLTLANGLNQTFITDPAYLADRFKDTGGVTGAAGDYVRLRDSTSSFAQIANAIGQVTARSRANGTITVTWQGSAPSFTTNGIAIVKANSLDDTADDYNKTFTGMMDILTSTSLHGLSSSTFPDWAAFADTTGGRFDGTRLEKQQDQIEDASGRSANRVIWAKGVKRDVKQQYKAGMMFNDAYNIPLDGNVKAEGVQFLASRRVPPGLVVTFAADALEKFFWKPTLDDQDGMTENDLLESEDITASIGRIDLVGNLVVNQRNAFAYARSLTEQ